MQKDFACSAVQGVLVLAGRFDMNAHGAFRSAYRKLLGGGDQPLRLSMEAVDYMDSSALGMLLLLRQEAESQGREVILAGCRPFVRNVLKTANFDRIFTLAAA